MRRKEREFNKMHAEGLKIKKQWISEAADDKTILLNKVASRFATLIDVLDYQFRCTFSPAAVR